MKIAGPIVVLFCGVIVLVGIFLPWASASMTIEGVTFSASVSGWEALSDLGIDEATEVFLVFIGGILIFVFALPAVIVSIKTEGSQKVVRNLCILASLGAAVATGVTLWLFTDAIRDGVVEIVSYGFYISSAAAVLGLIFGIMASVRARAQPEYKAEQLTKNHIEYKSDVVNRYCRNCGSKIREGSSFCRECGIRVATK